MKFFNRDQRLLFIILISHLVLWLTMYLMGYFTVSTHWYLLGVSLFLILGASWSWNKLKSRWFTAFLTAITLIVFVYTIISDLEEDYCWRKGDEMMESASQKYFKPSEEDLKFLGLSPTTSEVSVSWYEHMKCHKNYNIWKGIHGSYLTL